MLNNYLKIAFRNLARHRGALSICIVGLAVGIACCILIILFVHFELGYDKYHKNANRIFRVVSGLKIGEKIHRFAFTPAPLAPAMMDDLAGVECVVRIDVSSHPVFIKHRNDWIPEKKFLFSDPSIFKIFSFQFIKGNPDTALMEPSSIVITERAAMKYFGRENPLGKIITFKKGYKWWMKNQEIEDRSRVHKITGVLKNIPQNSHFTFDFIVPFSTYNNPYLGKWGAWNFFTYILLGKNYTPGDLERKFPDFLRRYIEKKASDKTLYLQPLPQIHLFSNIRGKTEKVGSVGTLYSFTLIAFIILLIACVNFVKLYSALSLRRAKEIGIRKILGSGRRGVLIQFLFESIFLSFLSLPLALLMVLLAGPAFNTIMGKEISINYTLLSLFPWFLFLTIVVGIISGGYPALFVSGFQPMNVLKGVFHTGQKKKSAGSVTIVFQFTFAAIFIVCSIIGYKQLTFIKTKNLGFDLKGIIQMPIHSKRTLDRVDAIKNELLKNQNIINVSFSSFSLTGRIENNSVWWEGQDEGQIEYMDGISIDGNFIHTMGIQLKAGGNFPPGKSSGYIINESAVMKTGWKSPADAIGKQIKYGSYEKAPIIGVVKNFNFKSLHQRIQPLVFFVDKTFIDNMFLKIEPGNMETTLAEIKNTLYSFDNHQPFEFSFLEETFANLHEKSKRTQSIFQYAAILNILIACIGLFGLTALIVERRKKEIGIRKCFGASTSNIVFLFLKDFTLWIVFCNIIAWPIAYVIMVKWLQDFAYRTGFGLWQFFLAGIISFSAGLLTVIYRVIKAALINPAETTKYEG